MMMEKWLAQMSDTYKQSHRFVPHNAHAGGRWLDPSRAALAQPSQFPDGLADSPRRMVSETVKKRAVGWTSARASAPIRVGVGIGALFVGDRCRLAAPGCVHHVDLMVAA